MLLRDVVYFRLARRGRVPRPSCCSAGELGLAMRPVIVSTRSRYSFCTLLVHFASPSFLFPETGIHFPFKSPSPADG